MSAFALLHTRRRRRHDAWTAVKEQTPVLIIVLRTLLVSLLPWSHHSLVGQRDRSKKLSRHLRVRVRHRFCERGKCLLVACSAAYGAKISAYYSLIHFALGSWSLEIHNKALPESKHALVTYTNSRWV
jgi:hypothetical protein